MKMLDKIRSAIAARLGGHSWELAPGAVPTQEPAPALPAPAPAEPQKPALAGVLSNADESLLLKWFDEMRPRRDAWQAPAWHPLPGGLLELGDTGFQIRSAVASMTMTYTLYSPEGGVLGFTADLQGLKRCGEQMARDRAEFEVRR